MPAQQSKTASTTNYSILADRAITALFVLIVLFSSSLFLAGTALAAGTSAMAPQIPLTGFCSNPSDERCYARTFWSRNTGGANTLIDPLGALRCYGCSGFIDDEMWFADTSSSQCTSIEACWVEAGISTEPADDPYSCNYGVDSTCAFWADNRPNGGGYHEHPLYNFGADGVSLTPYLFYITITNNTCCSSSGSTWNVSTNIYKNGSWIAGPGGQSTKNSMNANTITIGSELSDSGGSADTFSLEYNQWRNSSGSWIYQTTDGTNNSTNPPPHWYWATHPCNCGGNTGGAFDTYD